MTRIRSSLPSQPEYWIKATAETFFIEVDDLFQAFGPKEIQRYKKAAMWLARAMTGFSYPELARCFHRDDHTTIMNAVRQANKDDYVGAVIEEVLEYVEAERGITAA